MAVHVESVEAIGARVAQRSDVAGRYLRKVAREIVRFIAMRDRANEMVAENKQRYFASKDVNCPFGM